MITGQNGAAGLTRNRHSHQRPAAVTPSGVVAATLVRYQLDSPDASFLVSFGSLMSQPDYQVGTALAVADARIDPRIEDVDDQVGYDEQQGNHQDHTLHNRIVPLEDRLKHQPPNPRHGEDLINAH